jgi:hypothetical protein
MRGLSPSITQSSLLARFDSRFGDGNVRVPADRPAELVLVEDTPPATPERRIRKLNVQVTSLNYGSAKEPCV